MPGDTIDLKNVPYVSAASSYSFTYGSNGGANDLRITEGGQTYNLNVGSYYSLSGLLTLKRDASGTGTDIVYTSGGASPFQQWGAPLSNFFSTSSGPVDGSYWGVSNLDDGGQPVWIETETPASSYVAGQAGALQHRPHHPGLDRNRAAAADGTTTNVSRSVRIDPQGLGNLAGSTYVSNNGATGTMDLIYWQASATPGDYAVEFQPITTTYVSGPSTGPSTVLTGAPTQFDAAVSQPLSWDLVDNFTSNSAATEGLLGYSTQATATTEHIFLQGFSTSGVATADVRWNDLGRTWWSVSYTRERKCSTYDYYSSRLALPELAYTTRPSIPRLVNWAAQPPSF